MLTVTLWVVEATLAKEITHPTVGNVWHTVLCCAVEFGRAL